MCFLNFPFANSGNEIQKNHLASKASLTAKSELESVTYGLLNTQHYILFKLGIEINFDNVHFVFIWCFCVISKKSLLNLRLQRFSPCFLLKFCSFTFYIQSCDSFCLERRYLHGQLITGSQPEYLKIYNLLNTNSTYRNQLYFYRLSIKGRNEIFKNTNMYICVFICTYNVCTIYTHTQTHNSKMSSSQE